MKFKHYIQSEINRKEVEPSHDAWDRIQARMENQAPVVVVEKSSKKWWAIAAAVVGLAVCTTVYFSMEKQTNVPEMVKESTDINNSSEPSPQEQTPIEILNQVEEFPKTEMVESKPKNTSSTPPMAEEKVEIVSTQPSEVKMTEESQPQPIQKPSLASGLKSSQTPIQMATNLDTVKVKSKKKGNYVDPSMLLYSIENKEALKETQKEKTRVAVIDLNK